MSSVQMRWKDKRARALMERVAKGTSRANRTEILHAIGQYWVREIVRTFQAEGARPGLPPWPMRSPATIRTFHGTWKLAYGLDQYPRRTRAQLDEYRGELMRKGTWWVGKTGPMIGYEGDRRYNRAPRILQVSGTLKEAFAHVRRLRSDHVIVGAPLTMIAGRSRLVRMDDIIAGRPVLSITEHDRKKMVNTILTSIRKAARGA